MDAGFVNEDEAKSTGIKLWQKKAKRVLDYRVKLGWVLGVVVFWGVIGWLGEEISMSGGDFCSTDRCGEADDTMFVASATPMPKLVVMPTSETENKVRTKRENPEPGKSEGVFYPFSQGVTINNSRPTILGKVSQKEKIYLETSFGLEEIPGTGEESYFLGFLPGKVIGLGVMLDGSQVGEVYAIPQYPGIWCRKSLTEEDGANGKEEVYATKEECIEKMRAEMPPLIFFAKAPVVLGQGEHTLTLTGKEELMVFRVDVNYHLTSQEMYILERTDAYPFAREVPGLMPTDNCTPGYYYDESYLKMPLVEFDNGQMTYGLAFPQDSKEVEGRGGRVYISFEGKRFELFFPPAQIYYQGKKYNDYENAILASQEVFLPRELLVFADGRAADYVDVYQVKPQDWLYLSGYMEIVPVDETGGIYKELVIPWATSGSSSCDG